jgi:uncharacterized protein YbaR (Trm112 family)
MSSIRLIAKAYSKLAIGDCGMLIAGPRFSNRDSLYKASLLISQFRTPCYHFVTMAVNPELLKILVCPLCKASLEITNSGQGLKCTTCHRVYPIRDDIPVMMISEAKIEN